MRTNTNLYINRKKIIFKHQTLQGDPVLHSAAEQRPRESKLTYQERSLFELRNTCLNASSRCTTLWGQRNMDKGHVLSGCPGFLPHLHLAALVRRHWAPKEASARQHTPSAHQPHDLRVCLYICLSDILGNPLPRRPLLNSPDS